MRHSSKLSAGVKAPIVRIPLRTTALSAGAGARRGFPAWIDSAETGVPFTVGGVLPRVRDALVLRSVVRKETARSKRKSDGRRA